MLVMMESLRLTEAQDAVLVLDRNVDNFFPEIPYTENQTPRGSWGGYYPRCIS